MEAGSAEGGGSSASEKAVAEQAARVRSLYERQLAVPLADGTATLEAYEAWEQGLFPGWTLPEPLSKSAWKVGCCVAARCMPGMRFSRGAACVGSLGGRAVPRGACWQGCSPRLPARQVRRAAVSAGLWPCLPAPTGARGLPRSRRHTPWHPSA